MNTQLKSGYIQHHIKYQISYFQTCHAAQCINLKTNSVTWILLVDCKVLNEVKNVLKLGSFNCEGGGEMEMKRP
jgi:hypothetical protein